MRALEPLPPLFTALILSLTCDIFQRWHCIHHGRTVYRPYTSMRRSSVPGDLDEAGSQWRKIPPPLDNSTQSVEKAWTPNSDRLKSSHGRASLQGLNEKEKTMMDDIRTRRLTPLRPHHAKSLPLNVSSSLPGSPLESPVVNCPTLYILHFACNALPSDV